MAGIVENQMNQGGGFSRSAPKPRVGKTTNVSGDKEKSQKRSKNKKQQQGKGGAGDQDIAGMPTEKASEEEQEAYERVVLAGLKVAFSDESNEAVTKMLQENADTPATALAQATTSIMQSLLEQQPNIPPTVILPAAGEILANLRDYAKNQGIFEVNQQVEVQATQQMMASLAQRFGANPEEIQQLLANIPEESLQELVQQQEQAATQGMAQQGGGQPEPPAGGQRRQNNQQRTPTRPGQNRGAMGTPAGAA